MDKNSLLLNDDLLQKISGGVSVGEFFDITDFLQAQQYLTSNGVTRGSDIFNRLMAEWNKKNG